MIASAHFHFSPTQATIIIVVLIVAVAAVLIAEQFGKGGDDR